MGDIYLGERLVCLLGLGVMTGLAWLMSENRRGVPVRLLLWGIGLQFAIALIMLPTAFQRNILSPVVMGAARIASLGAIDPSVTLDQLCFSAMRDLVQVLTDATVEGSSFVFGNLATDTSIGAIVAFQVLPVIILVSAISSVLFHFGVIQAVVRAMAWLMRRTLKTSGAETFAAALQVFLGIESNTAIRKYLNDMTRSELCTVMTAFMATIAGSVMVVYTTFGAEPWHLLTASLMCAPAAIVMSKLMVPETGTPRTLSGETIDVPIDTHNVVDAAAVGTGEGLKLALNVAAMLIAFIGIVYLIDVILGGVTRPFLRLAYGPEAEPLTLKGLLGFFFVPFAWLMGVPGGDILDVARLLGTKTALNEFLAYADLQQVREGMSTRAVTIATYALCGFANPGSLGIAIAGFTSLAPDRRKDIVEMGVKSFIAGTLACFMTACIAGLLVAE